MAMEEPAESASGKLPESDRITGCRAWRSPGVLLRRARCLKSDGGACSGPHRRRRGGGGEGVAAHDARARCRKGSTDASVCGGAVLVVVVKFDGAPARGRWGRRAAAAPGGRRGAGTPLVNAVDGQWWKAIVT